MRTFTFLVSTAHVGDIRGMDGWVLRTDLTHDTPALAEAFLVHWDSAFSPVIGRCTDVSS